MWIYEHHDWPNFTWNAEALSGKLAEKRFSQGKLLGKMNELGYKAKLDATLETLIGDVIKSSAIEGEFLNRDDVRSSVARKLGIPEAGLRPQNRNVEGIVEIMIDATRQYSNPLTKERLFGWHGALFPTGRSGLDEIKVGDWRQLDTEPMQVVSGPIGRKRVHFEAPRADQLEGEMGTFLDWFNGEQDVDLILKAGIAHLWFVTIHPFADGNGRIGRAICDMALTRAENTSDRFYSLSTQVEAQKLDYHAQLERQQRDTPDITGWLDWFLDCFGGAVSRADQTLANVLFKTDLWSNINKHPVNERQRLIINRMTEEDFVGYMNTKKYASMARCSTDTALRDIQQLTERFVLIQNPGGGRSTSYRLTDDPQSIAETD